MNCPSCQGPDSKVTDSRSVIDAVRRRRQCDRCGYRFTTYERVHTTTLLVVKRDGRRQEYDRDKLLRSIYTACAKRPIPHGAMEEIAATVERSIQERGVSEVATADLGEIVMERLRTLDRVAYIRWASVYRNFEDEEGFEQVVSDLKRADDDQTSSLQLSMLEGGTGRQAGRRRRSRRRRSTATSH